VQNARVKVIRGLDNGKKNAQIVILAQLIARNAKARVIRGLAQTKKIVQPVWVFAPSIALNVRVMGIY
jgi:hypothetical protein